MLKINFLQEKPALAPFFTNYKSPRGHFTFPVVFKCFIQATFRHFRL